MALKYKISSTEFASLSDDMKKEYKMQGDFTYQLDLGENVFVTDKDPAGLMSALEAEREETRKAKAAADRLENEKKEAERAKITDVEELKAHFQKELEERDKRAEADRKTAEKRQLEQQRSAAEALRKQTALEAASSLFGTNAPLMLPHLEQALRAVPGDSPKVEIIDPTTGLPSVDQNLENWKKSLSTNELYKPMIVVSKASGGSANDGKGLGTSGTREDGKPKTYYDYKPSELLALKRENPELFSQIRSTKD